MELKIDGGKLYIDGDEAIVKRDGSLVSGVIDKTPLMISAGAVYLDGDFVGSIKYEQFVAWRETL